MANETHVYIAPDASGLNFHQTVPNRDKDVFVQFIDGNYRTDDDELAAAVDADIEAGHLSRWVRKVDRAAAEQLVRDHIAAREGTGAQTGTQTSQATANLNVLQARDQELHKLPDAVVDTVVDKLADESDLLLTVAAPVVAAPEVVAKPVGINFATKGAAD